MTIPKAPGIDVTNRRALEFWSRRFGITPEQLRRAVKQVGTELSALAKYLGKPGTSSLRNR
jgi:uncharacterized protein DUF3606